MEYLIYPEGFFKGKESMVWTNIREEIDKDFTELYIKWAKYSPEGFFPLNRSEGGICTDQEKLQVRTNIKRYGDILYENSIQLRFLGCEDERWSPELIRDVYMAFCRALEEIICEHCDYDNFPLNVHLPLDPLYSTCKF